MKDYEGTHTNNGTKHDDTYNNDRRAQGMQTTHHADTDAAGANAMLNHEGNGDTQHPYLRQDGGNDLHDHGTEIHNAAHDSHMQQGTTDLGDTHNNDDNTTRDDTHNAGVTEAAGGNATEDCISKGTTQQQAHTSHIKHGQQCDIHHNDMQDHAGAQAHCRQEHAFTNTLTRRAKNTPSQWEIVPRGGQKRDHGGAHGTCISSHNSTTTKPIPIDMGGDHGGRPPLYTTDGKKTTTTNNQSARATIGPDMHREIVHSSIEGKGPSQGQTRNDEGLIGVLGRHATAPATVLPSQTRPSEQSQSGHTGKGSIRTRGTHRHVDTRSTADDYGTDTTGDSDHSGGNQDTADSATPSCSRQSTQHPNHQERPSQRQQRHMHQRPQHIEQPQQTVRPMTSVSAQGEGGSTGAGGPTPEPEGSCTLPHDVTIGGGGLRAGFVLPAELIQPPGALLPPRTHYQRHNASPTTTPNSGYAYLSKSTRHHYDHTITGHAQPPGTNLTTTATATSTSPLATIRGHLYYHNKPQYNLDHSITSHSILDPSQRRRRRRGVVSLVVCPWW